MYHHRCRRRRLRHHPCDGAGIGVAVGCDVAAGVGVVAAVDGGGGFDAAMQRHMMVMIVMRSGGCDRGDPSRLNGHSIQRVELFFFFLVVVVGGGGVDLLFLKGYCTFTKLEVGQ